MDAVHLIHQHLAGIALSITRQFVWLLLLATVFVPLERCFTRRRATLFRLGWLTDVGYYFLNGIVPALALSMPLAAAAWLAHRLLPAGMAIGFADLPLAVRLLVTFVMAEIGFYWGHRWSHEIPLLWRFHVVHHSPTHLDWLVNVRGHPVDFIFTRLCGLIPLFGLGLAAPLQGSTGAVPFLVMLIGPLWGYFIHANVRWRFGKLEWLIASPAFHHWHHTNDGPALIDKNYAPMFPWIDLVFGTLYLPANRQPSVYGTHTAVSPNLIGQLLDPFTATARVGNSGYPSIDSTASAAASDGVPDAGRSSVKASANP